jgi:predicted nucleic acid-binding protein
VIAADSSSLIAYFAGESGTDVEMIAEAAAEETLRLPPVVVTELLSDEAVRPHLLSVIGALPKLDIADGYWERAGAMRALLRAKGLRAKIPDVLIAQSCLDHGLALISRDDDFRHFALHCGLKRQSR